MFNKIFLFLFVTLISCNELTTGSTVKIYKEGDNLDVTIYSSEQPKKLSDYNQFASMVVGDGIAIIKPDTVPKLIKIIHPYPDLIYNLARIDKNGYIWLVASDYDLSINDYIYVIDPHSETIYKSIKVPSDLRGPDAIAFGEDKAYFVGIGSGRSIGLGSIDRTNFSVENLAKIDSIGSAIPPGLELFNGRLYYFGIWTSQTDDRKILQFDTEKNQLVKTAPYSGHYTFDDNYLYTNGYFIIGDTTLPKLYKININELSVEQEISFGDKSYITCNEEFIYSANRRNPIVDVYNKLDLKKIKTIDFSNQIKIQGNYFNSNFGFISKDLLMVNQSSFYNVRTNEFMDSVFPLSYPIAESLVLAEGLELKSFSE
ncbi:MAG: hypothetical protein DWQ06_10645 [Calditrichaeota bacterium]|nr:MAG: hypothetical protein DWQ06_10645 [Calditrichota bacterium]